MQPQIASGPARLSRRTLTRSLAATMAIVLLVALVMNSRLPMRAARAYGQLFNKIQRKPVATAVICLTGATLLWGGIGLLAATQGTTAARKPE